MSCLNRVDRQTSQKEGTNRWLSVFTLYPHITGCCYLCSRTGLGCHLCPCPCYLQRWSKHLLIKIIVLSSRAATVQCCQVRYCRAMASLCGCQPYRSTRACTNMVTNTRTADKGLAHLIHCRRGQKKFQINSEFWVFTSAVELKKKPGQRKLNRHD